MHSFFPIVLIALFLTQGLGFVFSEKRSPFQNPNAQIRQRSVPKPSFSPPHLAQKPNKQEDHSKEVEFRGYFYLDGKPRFCLYNVKANFSEWVSRGGTTVEGFNAVDFREESETLVVAYKNHPEFNLNLYGPSRAPSIGSPSVSRPASIPARASAKSSGQPRVMPPVPQFKPPLPPSVANTRQQIGTPLRPSSTGTPPSSSSFGTRAPTPSPFPAFPGRGPGFPGVSSGQRVPVPTAPVSPGSPRSSRPVASVPSSSAPGSDPAFTPNPTPNPVTENELDLLNLPPPPPPPNILPPSAPPNIEPSREGE